jgi:SAM-dependent methyltransferase
MNQIIIPWNRNREILLVERFYPSWVSCYQDWFLSLYGILQNLLMARVLMFDKFTRWLRFNFLYLGRPPWDTGVSPPELKDFLKVTEPGRALDAGCGTGTNLLTMAKSGWAVVGVDISALSVLRARAKLRRVGFEGRVICGDITSDLQLTLPFDLVLDIGCYHSLSQKEQEKYRQNLKNWLAPGGTYLLYAHLRTEAEASHGVSEDDMQVFEKFLDMQWRQDNDEKRPDGGGGFPATWVRFDRKKAS